MEKLSLEANLTRRIESKEQDVEQSVIVCPSCSYVVTAEDLLQQYLSDGSFPFCPQCGKKLSN